MIPRIILLSLVAVFTAFTPLTADAKKLFVANIEVDDEVEFEGTDSLFKVVDFFDNKSLKEFFPDYTPDSAVLARVDLRGVGLEVEYHQNSSVLIVRIPSKNFEVTFDGGNRNESQEQFEDWLKGDFESPAAPSRKLTTLLHIVVANSPVEPVAGNPNSLLTRMFLSDFNAGITGPFISSRKRVEGNRNFLTLGGEFGFFNAGPYDGQVMNFPINYKWNFKGWPKLSWIFDLPITLTRDETGWAYMASFGTGFQFRPYKWWSITPMGRIGGVGSFDVGALAVLVSGSLTNYFQGSIGSTNLGFGTMTGISTTIDGIKVGGYDLSYELTNYVLRNGGNLTQKLGFNVLGNPAAFKLFLNHTKFWGNELYLNSFFDMGLAFVTIKKISDSFVEALDLSFTFSAGVDNDYNNYSIQLTYRF